MPKIYVYRNDTFRLHVMDAQEAKEEFYFEAEDLNAELSQNLVDRYKAAEKQFMAIQDEIYEALKKANISV